MGLTYIIYVFSLSVSQQIFKQHLECVRYCSRSGIQNDERKMPCLEGAPHLVGQDKNAV